VRMTGESVEEHLRAELVRGDALAGNLQPILRQLLAQDSRVLFSDAVLARVHGLASDLAWQLLAPHESAAPVESELSQALLEHPALLGHLHALALEWQLVERFEQQLAVDSVVSPLLQALIASPEATTQELAMKLLASQARWCQGQRRMQLTATELPGELFHEALLAMRFVVGSSANDAEARLRSAYDESSTRIALMARLVASMGNAASVALDLRHGGASLFASALALNARPSREQAIVWMHGSQTHLGLALRGAGLASSAVVQQIVLLNGEPQLPAGFERLSVERAATILGHSHVPRR